MCLVCGHSSLLERRLVIESIADEVAGGARSSGRAVVRCARCREGKQRKKKNRGKERKRKEKRKRGRGEEEERRAREW